MGMGLGTEKKYLGVTHADHYPGLVVNNEDNKNADEDTHYNTVEVPAFHTPIHLKSHLFSHLSKPQLLKPTQ